MPVIWHQAFLIFVQRYKKSINYQQKIKLKRVLKMQYHYQITPQVQKELFSEPTKITPMDIDI